MGASAANVNQKEASERFEASTGFPRGSLAESADAGRGGGVMECFLGKEKEKEQTRRHRGFHGGSEAHQEAAQPRGTR